MLKIFYKNQRIEEDPGLTVLEAGTDNYVLRSFNWWNTASDDKPLTGMEIDIAEGRIRAYSSNADIPGYCILIDASDDGSGNIPFMIGATKSPSFKINWDGSLFINDNSTTKVRAFWVDKDGNMRVYYNTTTKDSAFYLDSSGNLKINYDNDTKTAKFNISNKGAVAIGPDKFNIDENGNMWIAGKTLDTATFSIKNDGTVTMKKGSITLGEITKTDGSKVPAFYVDDNGNLTIGGDAFSVNASGSLTANQGFIGGWKITESSLESTPDEDKPSAQKMELKSDGSIVIGSYEIGGDDGETWSNAFEVTPYGIMKAANFELASGVVNTAMMMKGKMRIAATGNAATAKRQATQLFVDGTSYFSNNIYLDSSAVFIAAKGIYDIPTYDNARSCYVYKDGNKASTMGMVGFIQTFGDGSKIQYNGILFGGAGTVLWTEYNWIGKSDGTTTTYLNGNIHINATSDSGNIYFPHPNNIIVGGSQTLAQYIASEFTGEKPNVNFVANSAKWANKAGVAEKLIAEDYSVGGKT